MPLLRSFNEPMVEVDFDEQAHRYFYENAKMKPVTTLVSTMYPNFNDERMSSICAQKWGMQQSDVAHMWTTNGTAAAEFGTALHRWMEIYQSYGERALPKMQVARDIVTSFPWRDDLTAHAEVLITAVDKKLCGQCDRLVEKDGVYYVCDYKFNVGSEKVADYYANRLYPQLEHNKISKYQVQMSIYAAMLERSGLEVGDKVVAHVWDGEWTHYSRNRIKDILETV